MAECDNPIWLHGDALFWPHPAGEGCACACCRGLALGQVLAAPFLAARVARSRWDAAPVWMMWALKVSRSTTAAASRGSVKVALHSENGAFGALADDTNVEDW